MRRNFSFIQWRATAVAVVFASTGLSASAAEITSAHTNSNQMSRDLADTMAGSCDCFVPPMVPGNKGVLR